MSCRKSALHAGAVCGDCARDVAEHLRAEIALRDQRIARLEGVLRRYSHCQHSMLRCGCTTDAKAVLADARVPS